MLVAGIVLFLIGVAVMIFTAGDAERLGKAVAVIGVLLIVIAVVLGLLDEADKNGELGALFLPLALAGRVRL